MEDLLLHTAAPLEVEQGVQHRRHHRGVIWRCRGGSTPTLTRRRGHHRRRPCTSRRPRRARHRTGRGSGLATVGRHTALLREDLHLLLIKSHTDRPGKLVRRRSRAQWHRARGPANTAWRVDPRRRVVDINRLVRRARHRGLALALGRGQDRQGDRLVDVNDVICSWGERPLGRRARGARRRRRGRRHLRKSRVPPPRWG